MFKDQNLSIKTKKKMYIKLLFLGLICMALKHGQLRDVILGD